MARRRWALIIGCVLAAVGAAAVIVWQTTPTYVSTARLFVSTSQSETGIEAYQGSLFSAGRVASYAELALDPALASRVVDREQLEIDPSQFSEQISARAVPDTVILEVSVRDTDPERAWRLTGTTADELSRYIDQLETPPGEANAPIKATLMSTSRPTTPASPQVARDLTLAMFLGLGIGILAASTREVLDTSLTRADDATEEAAAPILVTIPHDPLATKGPLLTTAEAGTPRAEAFRVLRTRLQFIDLDKDCRVFVVTSALPGEGKTTIAANLAISFTQAGRRVLLLDGDLRGGTIADLLTLEPDVGLTTVLAGGSPFEDAIQYASDPSLAVLTTGAIPPNPAALLQTDAMRNTLGQARMNFDIVIIDAPPLLSADAALLARESDGALVVVRDGSTTKEQVRHALGRLDAVDARAVGIVRNRATGSGDQGSYSSGDGHRERRERHSRTRH